MTLSALLASLIAPRWQPSAAGAAAAPHSSAARSHVGLVRAINEDRVLDRPDAGLWAVIDGMGGHAAGDIAAEAALSALVALADAGAPTPRGVEAALTQVNATLHADGLASGHVRGATAVVLLRDERGFTLFWAGDCRGYRLHGGRVAQLTRDHSVVQELVDAGQLAPDQATRHPRANVVTRALGAAATLQLDSVRCEAATGDLLLLCSDGLTRCLPDLPALLGGDRLLDAAADALLAAALGRDGSDNISLVLVRA